MSKCTTPGCDTDVHAKNLCKKHYQRFQKYGTTDLVKKSRDLYLSKGKYLFIKHGYKNTTIAMISKEAGFTETNLQGYWKRKEDLFNEITEGIDFTIESACNYPELFAVMVEKELTERVELIKKLSELSPEILVSMI